MESWQRLVCFLSSRRRHTRCALVTGVQTCALPIWAVTGDKLEEFVPNLSSRLEGEDGKPFFYLAIVQSPYLSEHVGPNRVDFDFSARSEERRVGKECVSTGRSRWSPYH